MAGVGVAAQLVGHMEGWEVPVHSARCALINVACEQGWTGKILLHEECDMLHGMVHIVKRNEKRWVATTSWPQHTGGALITTIKSFGCVTLKHMQVSHLLCPAPAWVCSANELVECAAHLAESTTKSLMLCKRVSNADWVVRYAGEEGHLVRMMPASVVVLYCAEEHCIAVPSPVQLHVRHTPFVTGPSFAAALLGWLRSVFL